MLLSGLTPNVYYFCNLNYSPFAGVALEPSFFRSADGRSKRPIEGRVGTLRGGMGTYVF